jgi:hypothetical protein
MGWFGKYRFQPHNEFVHIFLKGSFLKMVKRTNLSVNDHQLLTDTEVEIGDGKEDLFFQFFGDGDVASVLG